MEYNDSNIDEYIDQLTSVYAEDIKVGNEYVVWFYDIDSVHEMGYSHAIIKITKNENHLVSAVLVEPLVLSDEDEDQDLITELEFNTDPDEDSEQGLSRGWYGEDYNFYEI